MKRRKLRFRKKIYEILLIALSLALTYSFAAPRFLNNSTAYAVGDLEVDWGVPDGDPIFVVNGMLPGDMESRSVDVTNNASTSRPVAIRSVKTSETANFSQVLDFVILEGITPIYGDGSATGAKTLDEFFTDAGPINGLPLSILGAGDTTTYTFKATFDPAAGNEFQNAQVIFDLIIGVGFDVPAECEFINFTGDPIFGTEGDDDIDGGNPNELIIVFEGDDKVNASNGDDCIIGGPGNDDLDGGSNGKDVVFGNEGDDIVDGSNGKDLLVGGPGNDQMFGTNGNDQMFGNEGDDFLDGSNGADNMIGGPGNDTFNGGNGNDYIEGNEGNDNMRGRNGNDTLLGGPDTDEARGDLGTDTCDAEVEISCEL